MDFGNYGGGVCEVAASDPSSATVANLLSSSSGASNGVGLGVPAFTKTTVSRSAVPEPDFGKPRTQDDRSADGSVLKIPFELQQQQQNHHSGGSGNSSSDGSAQQLQLLGRAHNSGGAAGIVGDVASPWAVHAHLQHQSYSPFRASAGMPRLPMAMPLSVMGMNGGGTAGAGAALNVQRGGGSYCFTPMQWQELEHQALIYKYILAEEPVPQELLIPIKRSLAGAADFLHHQPNLGGWNSFQMRFANVKADAEPGRCRRTDGKKWRCSRDAAPDQKYCERHMHRGRPRSRKPVEGGHTAAINGGGGSSSSNTNNNNSNNTSVSTSAATSSSASATATAAAAQSLNNNNNIIGGNPASSCNGSSSPSSFGSLASVSRSSVSSSVRPAATTDSSRAAAADQFLNLKSLPTAAAAAASTASINGGQSHFKSPFNMVKDYRYMNWMKGDNGNVSSSSEDHQLLLSDTHGSSKSHHQHHHHHHHLSNNSSNSNSCTTTDAQTHHHNQNQHIVPAAATSNLNPAAANNWRSCWGPPSTKLNMSSTAAQQAMLQRYSRSLMGSGGGSNNSSSHSHNTNHHSCNLSDFSVLQEQQNLSHHSNNNNTHSLFLTDTQQPLRHFIDDWGAAAAAAAAAAEEHSRSTATQLSMSSMAASTDLGLGLMNNNSTTTNTNTSDRHSHHSTNNNNNNRSSSSNSYVPVALGGPLAEVLQHNSAAPVNPAAAAVAGLCRSGTTAVKASAGALNLLSNEVWELSSTSPQESPRMASSPTGVLQKTLASLSDSSSGSTAAAAVKHDTLHNLASV